MASVLDNVVPILFLIIFGCVLQRIHYFEEVSMQRLTNMVSNLLIPCVIFNTIVNLEIRREHLVLAVGFIVYQFILLGLSWGIYRIFKIKRRMFPFFSCAFAFGFMAVPLFSNIFGVEHMDYLVAMGVGHETFVALVFIPLAKLYLKEEKTSGKNLVKNLASPLFFMIGLALVLKVTGLYATVNETILGRGFFGAVSKLGSMTTILTMIIVGYRIHFQDRSRILESFGYVAFRYALTFCVGYLLKGFVFDRLVEPSPYFDYAFFTLLSQHGSVILTVFVGEYGTKEDLEVASNAFVINVVVGILLFLGFMLRLA
ncbi:MAG: AEC family transporter [Clostridiales bacterium]|nr:AEC family transporter [Clostridiales bacterium]